MKHIDGKPVPGGNDKPRTFDLTLHGPWLDVLEHIAAARDRHSPDVFGLAGHVPGALNDAFLLGLAELARRHGLADLIDAIAPLPGRASLRDELADVDRRHPPAAGDAGAR